MSISVIKNLFMNDNKNKYIYNIQMRKNENKSKNNSSSKKVIKSGSRYFSRAKSVKKSMKKSMKKPVIYLEAEQQSEAEVKKFNPKEFDSVDPKPTKTQKLMLEYENKELLIKDELIAMQKIIKIKYSNQEQSWVETNLAPIIDLMGQAYTWRFVIPNVDKRLFLHGDSDVIRYAAPRGEKGIVHPLDIPRAFWSGSHWTAIKAGETQVFDPYDEYQINGTNQFCQAYSMMYLLDMLPKKITSNDPNSISKYYNYTKHAIEFIIKVLEKYPYQAEEYSNTDESEKEITFYKNYYVNRAKNCLKYYAVCLNSIELYIE